MPRLFFSAACLLSLFFASAQETKEQYLARINSLVPHKFRELKTRCTLEAIREQGVVKLYLLVEDVEQYEQIVIERSDEMQTTFSQCKLIEVKQGKFKNNYLETVDKYPVSSKMTNLYRVKGITPDGVMVMFAPVTISTPDTVNK